MEATVTEMITPHPIPMDPGTRLREGTEAQTTTTLQTHMARATRPQEVMEVPTQPEMIATAPTRSRPMAHPAMMMTQTPVHMVPVTRPQADTAAQTQLAMIATAQETPPPRRAPAMETMILPLIHTDLATRLQAAMVDPTPLAMIATVHPIPASRSRPTAHLETTMTPAIPMAPATRRSLVMDKVITAMALVTIAEVATTIQRLASCWRRSEASLAATSCSRRASRSDRMLEITAMATVVTRARTEVETITTMMTIR